MVRITGSLNLDCSGYGAFETWFLFPGLKVWGFELSLLGGAGDLVSRL